ncbi:putative metabolite transport protein [Violaceomyces palustris]|uniref:Metabolite transport protein n=1 Tax=Violaceomyces palustris TaxID=1673888 RepID=A0ACD0NVU3_9BASI|nr:putative metabolite transport protein [Violaceomyces palustris]
MDESSSLGGKGTSFTVIWSGVALASDGYNAQALGSVLPILKKLYPEAWSTTVKSRISTAYYVGVCLGAILFGSLIDNTSRKAGVVSATLLMLLGVALCSGSSGTGSKDSLHWAQGMFWMLSVGRGVLGIGAGGEYPVCSVNATEAGDENDRLRRRRGLLVGLAGCTSIDFGIVMGGVVPLIVLAAYGYRPSTPADETVHLDKAWRIMLGLGGVIPLSVFYFRWKMSTTTAFERRKRDGTSLGWRGWWVVLNVYKWRILGTCLSWALYDAVAYPFGLFSTTIVDQLSDGKSGLISSIGWSALINSFLLPGCLVGSYSMDYFGRRNTQAAGFALSALVAFVLGGALDEIQSIFPLFVVLYGILLALSEAGPGVATILTSAECYPTLVRGHLLGLSAACGKAGAAIGTVAFSAIQDDLGGSTKGVFLVGGGFSLLGAIVTLLLIPEMSRDLGEEDERLNKLLIQAGVIQRTPSSYSFEDSQSEEKC